MTNPHLTEAKFIERENLLDLRARLWLLHDDLVKASAMDAAAGVFEAADHLTRRINEY